MVTQVAITPVAVRPARTSVTVPVTIASADRVSASSLIRTIVVARAGLESSNSAPASATAKRRVRTRDRIDMHAPPRPEVGQ
jgi:hypothetical protein